MNFKEGDLLKKSINQSPPLGGNLVENAVKLGVIHSFSRGQWLYSGRWVQIFRQLQSLFVRRIQSKHEFEEWMFPRMIPKEAIDSFQLSHYKPGMLWEISPYQSHLPPGYVLDPVQCVSMYHYLSQKTLSKEILPIKVIECMGGWTWRNEDPHALQGPIRAREFARIENVFVGLPDQVRSLRKRIEAEITNLLSDLQITWRVVVGTGCMEIPSLSESLRDARSFDEVPVHDVEILIDSDEWLEIAGCTVEGDHLVRSFSIAADDGNPLWSGCCGLGMNRLIAGIFLQHGFDVEPWPDPVKKLLDIN